jgi:hypothetical protein
MTLNGESMTQLGDSIKRHGVSITQHPPTMVTPRQFYVSPPVPALGVPKEVKTPRSLSPGARRRIAKEAFNLDANSLSIDTNPDLSFEEVGLLRHDCDMIVT